MAKKSHVKVRLVPEAKPDSAFYYYVKKPSGGEKEDEINLDRLEEIDNYIQELSKIFESRVKE